MDPSYMGTIKLIPKGIAVITNEWRQYSAGGAGAPIFKGNASAKGHTRVFHRRGFLLPCMTASTTIAVLSTRK
jgi:hypothetical protein